MIWWLGRLAMVMKETQNQINNNSKIPTNMDPFLRCLWAPRGWIWCHPRSPTRTVRVGYSYLFQRIFHVGVLFWPPPPPLIFGLYYFYINIITFFFLHYFYFLDWWILHLFFFLFNFIIFIIFIKFK